jgi:hypothetical protein
MYLEIENKAESTVNNMNSPPCTSIQDIALNTLRQNVFYPQHIYALPSNPAKITWRKGKWTEEEEAYTKRLIEAFNSGKLKIPSGTTLRSYLSEKLCW